MTEEQDERPYNPYEAADPIPVSSYPKIDDSKGRDSSFTMPRRTRTVQSAQDAALRGNRQKLDHVDEEAVLASPVRNKRPSTERATLVGSDSTGPMVGTNQGEGSTPNDRSRRFPLPLAPTIGIAAAVLVILLVVALWPKPPVTITVNGKTAEVPANSTLKEVMDAQGIIVNPGDLVTVGGNLMIAHNGYAFSAQLNGKDLSQEEIDSYRVRGSESVVFSDGKDRTEEYDAVTEVIEPYLRMEGSGYELQYVSQWAQEGVLEHRTGKQSGEKADVMTQEARDCVITCRNLELDGDERYVALTFDDGPTSPYTEQVLEILDEHGVRATFYNLGDQVNANPELCRRVVEAGHQVANHTMAHNQLIAIDDAQVREEIVRSAAAIETACGVATTHIRPPYGDFSERSWLASGGTITAAIRWSGDSQDWKLPGAEAIVENALLNVHSGTIILMHDGGGDRSQDVEALPTLIDRLQDEGYELVTVSELMRAAGDIPEEVCSGTGTMPEGAVWPDQIAPEDIAASGGATS